MLCIPRDERKEQILGRNIEECLAGQFMNPLVAGDGLISGTGLQDHDLSSHSQPRCRPREGSFSKPGYPEEKETVEDIGKKKPFMVDCGIQVPKVRVRYVARTEATLYMFSIHFPLSSTSQNPKTRASVCTVCTFEMGSHQIAQVTRELGVIGIHYQARLKSALCRLSLNQVWLRLSSSSELKGVWSLGTPRMMLKGWEAHCSCLSYIPPSWNMGMTELQPIFQITKRSEDVRAGKKRKKPEPKPHCGASLQATEQTPFSVKFYFLPLCFHIGFSLSFILLAFQCIILCPKIQQETI